MPQIESPSNKVTAGALAGALTTIIVFILVQFAGITIPAEIAVALLTIISFLVSYFVKD